MNDMIDMSRFTEAKSDQLNADDLIGVSRTITVTRVTGAEGDQPIAIHYENDGGKPFKPCKTIRRVLLAVWGRYANDYVGRSMTVYRDDKVTFGGLEVGGIRISHMSHIDKEMVVVVAKSKGKKAGMKILPLMVEKQADKAAEWASSHIAALGHIDALDALDAHIAAGEKAMTKLQAQRPELHKQVTDSYAIRRDMLSQTENNAESSTDEGEDEF